MILNVYSGPGVFSEFRNFAPRKKVKDTKKTKVSLLWLVLRLKCACSEKTAKVLQAQVLDLNKSAWKTSQARIYTGVCANRWDFSERLIEWNQERRLPGVKIKNISYRIMVPDPPRSLRLRLRSMRGRVLRGITWNGKNVRAKRVMVGDLPRSF